METALGASIAGASFCGMKHVGLNVAADPLYTAGYTGVNAGMVIAVAGSQGMHSSQNEQDSRHHAIASKVPITWSPLTQQNVRSSSSLPSSFPSSLALPL